ncbi:MAG: nucleoside hydrolase [Candidatus Shapirobacteria bacterium]|nr:nucleoside hydrolase [Candidatus Shapirobacteria bacterium]
MKQIIIDTDPGVDDALAILLAISSKLNIVGITTTYGNSNIENTTRNALSILQILNSNIPVYPGAATPLSKKSILAKSHGSNGLGNFNVDLRLQPQKISATQFLINSLSKNPNQSIDIVCLGPTTNLALLKIIRPDLISKINQIIILGGVFNQKGNTTSKAEFNVYSDPLALKIVLEFPVAKIIIPINICRQVTFTLDELNQIKNTKISNNFKKIADFFINYYQNNQKYGGFKGGVMYDVLAIAYLANQKSFKIKKKYISVDLNGQTQIQEKLSNNCTLITDSDPKEIKKLFFNSINNKY